MAGMDIEQLGVLLVEPSPIQQKLICGYLKSLGVKFITSVASGEDALESMRKEEPDLVISAMYFEGMSGNDLLSTMRTDEALAQIPFILVSSETNFRYLDPVRQSGVISILSKPFEIGDLKRALMATADLLAPEALSLDDIDVEELKVLIVDDSPMARNYITKTLKALGIEHVTAAGDGKEAIEIIQSNYFDFIVTDYNMPEMDGHALVNYIRQESDQRTIPILMVTSENDASRLAAVEQSGVSAVCDKPFDINVVRTMIQNFMA